MDNLSIKRIGIPAPSKSQPICVKLDSREDVFKVILNQELIGAIKVSTDSTPEQRKFLKQLNAEKIQHNALYYNGKG